MPQRDAPDEGSGLPAGTDALADGVARPRVTGDAESDGLGVPDGLGGRPGDEDSPAGRETLTPGVGPVGPPDPGEGEGDEGLESREGPGAVVRGWSAGGCGPGVRSGDTRR
ncbi:hypothetical protein [Streptomyces manipurensis]|uniref:hypothetical protein n=1 Tax=Streptomyces manipurensis TaxID=1077945 RepID=UPI003C6F1520